MEGWCDVPAGYHCLETPNHACHGAGEDHCRVLLKDSEAQDRYIVEEMISNASLPLIIVYTQRDMRKLFFEHPNQTFLFHHWEV